MLNEKQVEIIDTFLKYAFDTITDVESLELIFQAFQACIVTPSTETREKLEKQHLWDVINQIRSILDCDYPQNITSGSTYVGGVDSNGIDINDFVLFTPIGNSNGIVKEKKGLLGLTSKDDILLYINQENYENRLPVLKEIKGILIRDEKGKLRLQESEDFLIKKDIDDKFILKYNVTADDVITYVTNKIQEKINLYATLHWNLGFTHVASLDSETITNVCWHLREKYPEIIFDISKHELLWFKLKLAQQKFLIESSSQSAYKLYKHNQSIYFSDKASRSEAIYSIEILQSICASLSSDYPKIAEEIITTLFSKNDQLGVVGTYNKISFSICIIAFEMIKQISEKQPELAARIFASKEAQINIGFGCKESGLFECFKNPKFSLAYYNEGIEKLLALNAEELFTLCLTCASDHPEIIAKILLTPSIEKHLSKIRDDHFLYLKNDIEENEQNKHLFIIQYDNSYEFFFNALTAQYPDVKKCYYKQQAVQMLSEHFDEWMKKNSQSFTNTLFINQHWLKKNNHYEFTQWLACQEVQCLSFITGNLTSTGNKLEAVSLREIIDQDFLYKEFYDSILQKGYQVELDLIQDSFANMQSASRCAPLLS